MLELWLLRSFIEPNEPASPMQQTGSFACAGTRHANGLFVTAIWGLSIDREVEIAQGMVLVPFDNLAKSAMKRRIANQAKAGTRPYGYRNAASTSPAQLLSGRSPIFLTSGRWISLFGHWRN